MSDVKEEIAEVWLLRIIRCGDDADRLAGESVGNFVRSIDEAGDPVLAYADAESARLGAEAHYELWGIACRPERIFPNCGAA